MERNGVAVFVELDVFGGAVARADFDFFAGGAVRAGGGRDDSRAVGGFSDAGGGCGGGWGGEGGGGGGDCGHCVAVVVVRIEEWGEVG